MDYYHIWCDLRPGEDDLKFAKNIETYLSHLVSQGMAGGFRVTRRKLGLGPEGLGEFHIILETSGLAQLDAAFQEVARRSGKTEDLHRAVFQVVTRVQFGLYRDFPDDVRGVEG